MKQQPQKPTNRAPRLGLLVIYPVILLGLLYVSVFLVGNSRWFRLTAESAINHQIPGRMVFGEVRLGARLIDLEVFRVQIYQPHHTRPVVPADIFGDEGVLDLLLRRSTPRLRDRIIDVDHLEASINPLGLLRGEVVIPRTELFGPAVLVQIDPKGEVGIARAFDAGGGGGVPEVDSGNDFRLRMGDIHLHDGRFLLTTHGGLTVRLEGLEVIGATVAVIDGDPIITGQVASSGGRAVMLPELFRLVDVRESDRLRRYRRNRRADPWAASSEEHVARLRGRYWGDWGALVQPLGGFEAEGFTWENEGFSLSAFALELGSSGRISGRGRLSLLDDKVATLHFDARGQLRIVPSAPLLAYFVEEMLYEETGPGVEPIVEVGFEAEGTLAEVAAELRAELRDVQLAEWPVQQLVLQLATEAGQPFELVGEGLRLEADGGVLMATGLFDPADGSYALDAWLDEVSMPWLVQPLVPDVEETVLAGTLTSQPAVPGPASGSGLRLSGELDAKRMGDFLQARLAQPGREPLPDLALLEAAGLTWRREAPAVLPVRTVTLSGALRLAADGRLHMHGADGAARLALALGNERVRLRGALDLPTETLEGVRIEGETRSLSRLFDRRDIDGSASVALRVGGPLSDPSIRVTRLTGSNLSAEGIDVERLTASADVRLTESLPDLDGVSISGRNASVGPVEVSEFDAQLGFERGRLRIGDAFFSTQYGNFSARGWADLMNAEGDVDSDPQLDLSVRGNQLNLAAFLPEYPVAGSADVEATVRGTPRNPRVEGTVAIEEAILMDEWIDQLGARFAYSNAGVTIDDLLVTVDDATLRGAARFDSEATLQAADLQIRSLDLQSLRVISSIPIAIGGDLQLDMAYLPPEDNDLPAGLGPADGYPDIEGSIILRNLSVDGTAQGAIAFAVDTFGDEVIANGQIASDFDTRVVWPLEPERPIQVESRFAELPIELIFPSIADVVERGEAIGGRINAEIRWADTVDLVSEVSIDRVELISQGRRLETARPIHLSYVATPGEDGALSQRLAIDELSFGAEEHFLELSGEIRDWDAVNLNVSGETPLSLVTLFTTAVADVDGTARVGLDVTGTLENPIPVGRIDFTDARFTPRGLGQDITVSSGGIVLTEPEHDDGDDRWFQRLRIDDDQPLVGQVFGGPFSLRGQALIDEFQPYSIYLTLDATTPSYRLPNEASVTFSRADLSLSAQSLDNLDESEFFLSGNLFVQEGIYYRDIGGDAGVAGTVVGLFERQSVERYRDPIWVAVPELERLGLNVRLVATDGFTVRNKVLGADVDLELRFDLLLTGTVVEPRLTGEIDVLEGDIRFRNRVFEVQSCTLGFDGRNTSDGIPIPNIENCVAEARIQTRGQQSETAPTVSGDIQQFTLDDRNTVNEFIVRVIVSGHLPDSITLEFESPGLDERDVLALILTGQTFDQVTSETASYQGLELVGTLVTDLAERSGLSVDELVVAPTADGNEVVIYLSDQVSQRLTVDVGATIFSEEETEQVVRGQIILFDWMLLEVVGQSDSENTVEAGGRIRFRIEL